MADKMMRIAGRGDDGLAKAIKTNNDGILQTNNKLQRQLFGAVTLNPNTGLSSDIKSSNGNNKARLMFHCKDGFDLYIRYINLNNAGAEYNAETWVPVYSNPIEGAAGNKRNHDVVVQLKSQTYQYRIVSKSNFAYQLGADNIEILYSDVDLPSNISVSSNMIKERFFKTTVEYVSGKRQALWTPSSSTAPDFLDSKGLQFINIRAKIDGKATIFIRYRIGVTNSSWEQVYSHLEGKSNYIHFSYALKHNVFQLMIQNDDSKNINIQDEVDGEGLTLTQFPIYDILNYKEKTFTPFAPTAVSAGQILESDELIRTKKLSGVFRIQSVSNFDLMIKYFNYGVTNTLEEVSGWELVKSCQESDLNERINYEIPVRFKTSYFKLAIKNTTKYNMRIGDNTLVLTDEIKRKEATKVPSSTLKFKPIKADVRAVHKANDGLFYAIDSNGLIKVYESLIDGSEPKKTGIDISSVIDISKISNFYKTSKGLAIFTSFGPTATAYYAKDVDTVPTQVWTCPRDTEQFYQVNCMDNGIDTLILASVYGYGNQDKRELLLSIDGGQSYSVIKQTVGPIEDPVDNDQATANSHFHGNAIDIQSGYIYVLEGDRQERSHIWYSKDLGKTWGELTGESGINMQPTLVIPFSDRVSFIRDGKYVGVDEALKPTTAKDTHGIVRQNKEFNDQNGWAFFGKSETHEGQEAYATFQVQSGAERPIIVGTGDGGKSWHQLFWGINNVGDICFMDEENIYVYKDKDRSSVIYAKKPSWEGANYVV